MGCGVVVTAAVFVDDLPSLLVAATREREIGAMVQCFSFVVGRSERDHVVGKKLMLARTM